MNDINKRAYRILDHIKAGTMKALVLGHSFVRRLRDWIRDNDKEMSRGSLDVHSTAWGKDCAKGVRPGPEEGREDPH